MRILVKENNAVVSDLVFQGPEIHIGSTPDCNIHLPDMRVRDKHARLLREDDGSWRIEHLGGSPTLVNGRPLTQVLALSNGDQVTIEDYTLNIYLDFVEREQAESIASPPPIDGLPLPPGAVVRTKGESILLTPEEARSLAHFAMTIAGSGAIESVMDSALAELLARFAGRAAWIGVRRAVKGPLEYTQGRDWKGQSFEVPKLYSVLIERCLDRGSSVWVGQVEGDEDTTSLIAVPLISPAGRLGFLYLDSRKDGARLGDKQFGQVMALAAVIADRLHAILSQRIELRRAVAVAEGSVVQAIQAKLDPKNVPEWPGLQVAAHCTPGEVGVGDIYDIMPLPNGAAAFLVGHVTASGVNAAIGMIEARTAFRIAVLHADMPHVVMREFNWLITTLSEAVTMQCSIVMLDAANGAMLYCIAGTPCAVVIGRSGHPRWLDAGGAPDLGKVPGFEYNTRKGLLGKSESLAMFTSGVGKLKNAAGEHLDRQQFVDTLCDGFGVSARTALDETLADLSQYLSAPADDVTILLAHRK